MKKFWFQFIGLALVITVATFLAFNQKLLKPLTGSLGGGKSSGSTVLSQKTLQIVDESGNIKAQLKIELADTADKRAKGLGYRQSLATNSGMLFIHDKPQKYTYWMKGMEFPIDIIWIMDDQIVDIIPNIPIPIEGQSDENLERYAPIIEANRVLETNSGYAIDNNLQKGDKIIISN